MLQKILVPLDGTGAAEIALPFSEEIAAKSNASIVLIAASRPEQKDSELLLQSYLERVKGETQTRLKSYGIDAPSARLLTRVLKGARADESGEINADLIIMASQSSTGHGQWPLGGIISKAAMASSKPVLFIKKPARNAAVEQKRILKRILVALDGSACEEAVLLFAAELAKTVGSELILFHALEPLVTWVGYGAGGAYMDTGEPENVRAGPLAYLESVRNRMIGTGLSIKIVLEEGSPAELIVNYARNEAIDVIAISTHGRSGISRWVYGSVTEKVLQNGESAVLVVRSCKA